MNSPLVRRIAIAVAVVFVLLAIAVAILVVSFDANRYKGLAIDWMKTERNRTLVIDGPIELTVLPRLALKLSNVSLSEKGRADAFASVDEASLSLELLPLLRKQLVIDRVAARGVRVAYLRDAKGLRNIDDLIAADAGAAPASGAAPRFAVSGLQLDDVQLQVRDTLANVAGMITLQSLRSGRLANQGEAPVSLRASVDLTQPQALQLSLAGDATLALDLDKGTFAVSRMKLGVKGDSAAAKAIDVALEGALAWDGQALRAEPLQVAITSATLAGIKLNASKLAVKRALFNRAGQQLELDALKLALAGQQGAHPFELALDWPQLAVTGERLKGSALSGRFKLTGATTLEGKFQSAPPTGNFDALRLPGFSLTLAGSSGPRKIDGSVKTDLLLRPARSSVAFERLDLRAALQEPGLQPLQLALNGNGNANAQAAQWTLAGSLNANRFDSSGSASFGGAVPQVKATARFDALDLNKLLAANKSTPAAAQPADSPVLLDGLRAVNGQFALSAGEFVFRQYKLADARLDATLDGGTLRIARLAGRAWGGSIDASGSADARTQRIAIKLAASGVNVNALLRDVAGKDLLDGTGRVTADVTTSGRSLSEMRSRLAGSAALQLRDGAIKGINLARSLRQAKAALSMKQDAVTKAQQTEKTDFSELTASARIADGVARSDDLDLKSPFLRLGGAGQFDIGRGRIDYVARATVVGAAAGQDAGELAALRGVTVPVLLSGPFEAIDWKIQWSGVAAAAVQNKLRDKLGEALGGKLGLPGAGAPAAGAASAPVTAKDKLKESLLKGLFK